MSINEFIIWFSLGTLGIGLDKVTTNLIYGLTLIFVGIVGSGYGIREHWRDSTANWSRVVAAFVIVVTWGAIAWDMYDRYYVGISLPLVVTIAADAPSSGTPLEVIPHQTFEGGDIPLDGHIYENCTFTDNACLLYNGGAYRLENVTFETVPRLCVHTPELQNYAELLAALKLSTKPLHSRSIIPWWK
jgi:hypothetical protein